MSLQELADTLKAINNGTIPPDKARDILSKVNAVDLSLAEQKLIEEGTKPEELRRLCDIHLELIQMEAEELKKNLEWGHPLYTLISEHDLILGFLDRLEASSQSIFKKDMIKPDDSDLRTIREAVRLLLDTENHHAREEEALFPELETKEITGPTRIMRMEHEELRGKKKELNRLLAVEDPLKTEEAKLKILDLVGFIIHELREHIMKENSILYPSAFQTLSDPKTWSKIREKSDQIGYCSFTPRQ